MTPRFATASRPFLACVSIALCMGAALTLELASLAASVKSALPSAPHVRPPDNLAQTRSMFLATARALQNGSEDQASVSVAPPENPKAAGEKDTVPDTRVTAIVQARAGAEAMINGQLVRRGDLVPGVGRVKTIGLDHVVVGFQEGTVTLRLGASGSENATSKDVIRKAN